MIGNSWNCHENPEYVHRIAQSKYPTVVFTYGEYDEGNCIKLDHDIWHLDNRCIVRPDITAVCDNSGKEYFEDMFDFVGWLNEETNKDTQASETSDIV